MFITRPTQTYFFLSLQVYVNFWDYSFLCPIYFMSHLLTSCCLFVAAPSKCLTMFTGCSIQAIDDQCVVNSQLFRGWCNHPVKETDFLQTSPLSSLPFSHSLFSGHFPAWESLIQDGKEAKMMKTVAHPSVNSPATVGFQNNFFKSKKKLAIKTVFVYSMRISIIHVLFSPVKLSVWSFFKKCIKINISQFPGILSMLWILSSTPPWRLFRLFQFSLLSSSRFYHTAILLLGVACPKGHVLKSKDLFLIHWSESAHSPRTVCSWTPKEPHTFHL